MQIKDLPAAIQFALGGDVFLAEFDGIHADLVGEFVHEGFHGEAGLRMARGAKGHGAVFVGGQVTRFTVDDTGAVLIRLRRNRAATQAGEGILHDLERREHALRHGLIRRGEDNPRARLTESSVRDIRRRHAAGETIRRLAREFDLAEKTISLVVNRGTWKHVA